MQPVLWAWHATDVRSVTLGINFRRSAINYLFSATNESVTEAQRKRTDSTTEDLPRRVRKARAARARSVRRHNTHDADDNEKVGVWPYRPLVGAPLVSRFRSCDCNGMLWLKQKTVRWFSGSTFRVNK